MGEASPFDEIGLKWAIFAINRARYRTFPSCLSKFFVVTTILVPGTSVHTNRVTQGLRFKNELMEQALGENNLQQCLPSGIWKWWHHMLYLCRYNANCLHLNAKIKSLMWCNWCMWCLDFRGVSLSNLCSYVSYGPDGKLPGVLIWASRIRITNIGSYLHWWSHWSTEERCLEGII